MRYALDIEHSLYKYKRWTHKRWTQYRVPMVCTVSDVCLVVMTALCVAVFTIGGVVYAGLNLLVAKRT